MDWQPIKTAPKDGTRILAYWPNIFEADNATQSETWWGPRDTGGKAQCWQTAYEYGGQGHGPSHWMPLPKPPK